MEYINKIPYLERERHIDIAYLQDCFSKDDGSFYPEIDSDQSYSMSTFLVCYTLRINFCGICRMWGLRPCGI